MSVQRNLPLADIYCIESFRYVPLIDGDGTCCDNCGKPISNIVTIKNTKNEKFTVGNDCAKTLVADKTDLLFKVEPAFNEGKSLRAKIIKHFKSGTIIKAYIYTNNDKKFIVLQNEKGASSMQQINHFETTISYIKDLLTKN